MLMVATWACSLFRMELAKVGSFSNDLVHVASNSTAVNKYNAQIHESSSRSTYEKGKISRQQGRKHPALTA